MENKELDLKEIALHLMLNASFTKDMGLFGGKMGISIFFAQYSRFTKESIWDDYAGYLLDEIYKDIHTFLPVNLEDGLCGIGYGIEYLVQNGYMDGNTSEILEDLDKRLMERDPERIKDYSLETGMAGILLYAYMRIASSLQNNRALPFDQKYLLALNGVVETSMRSDATDELTSRIIRSYSQLITMKQCNWNPYWLWEYLWQKESDELPFYSQPLGIRSGLSGIAMKEIEQVTNRLKNGG